MGPSGSSVLSEARNMVGMPAIPPLHRSPLKYGRPNPNPPRLQSLHALPELKPVHKTSPLLAGTQSQSVDNKTVSDAELRCRNSIERELSKLQSVLGAADHTATSSSANPGTGPNVNELQFLQGIVEKLKTLRGKYQESAKAGNSEEAVTDLQQKVKKLEQDNAKCRRYIQRQRANIEKLQGERKKYAEEKAQFEFKLVEALAGRGQEAAALLQGVKLQPGSAGRASANDDDAETKLRERHAQSKAAEDSA
eukprot:SAG31_NODE_61_length_29286_cov_444.645973_16_plen_251_part_00